MFKRAKTTNNVQNAVFQEALAISERDAIESQSIKIQQDNIYNSLKSLQEQLKNQIKED